MPSLPSTTAITPSVVSSSGISVPINAGIAMVLAKIAVWEFVEPCTVTNESTLSLSSCTVSDGARSSAKMITGSSVVTPVFPAPERLFNTLSEISFTSAARPLI